MKLNFYDFKGNDKELILEKDIQLLDDSSVYIEKSVRLGKGITIFPNVFILGDSEIGDNAIIYPNSFISGSIVGRNAEVQYSHIENSFLSSDVKVGPFARIRPGSFIGEKSKIGNFVEIKNSKLEAGVKAGHLAYIGDADIGENVNVGCGAIFVNYDGKNKNRSSVGKNAFIGSNVNIISPVVVGENSYICAGSTLTIDTEKNDFVIARSREVVKKNRGGGYLKCSE